MPNLIASWIPVRDSMKMALNVIQREKPLRGFDRHEIYVVLIALFVRVNLKESLMFNTKTNKYKKNMALRCIVWEVVCKLEQKCRNAFIGMTCSIKNHHCYLDLMISVL